MIPHIPEHSVDTNEATMAPTPENAPCRHNPHGPREINVHQRTHMKEAHIEKITHIKNDRYHSSVAAA